MGAKRNFSDVNTPASFGIIPAYAGQIVFLVGFLDPVQDHPRIRGTNLEKKVKDLDSSRIIPAYAGQIWPRYFSSDTP